ncbi:MAG: hypothetical protein KAX18_11300 [Candidatus Lokiarchaeota archaeon]|nr:hypothetical protein [Candidatus Lokiarchaeota archaeon]
MRKAFIISPIGEEGSKIRQHADDVFDFIIKPALEAFNIELIRSDKIAETGKISNQIYNSIQSSDLCVVVLSFDNPNVFYELAVAQCAVRPVIILIEEGHTLPFDIKDERSVFYDLKARSYVEKKYINAIIEIIKKLEENDYKVEPSIPGFKPLNEKDITLEFLGQTQNFGSHNDWSDVYKSTEKVFYLMGITLDAWRRGKDFEKHMVDKASKGLKIKMLLMHEENPALLQMIYEKTGVSVEKVKSDIKFNFKTFSEIAEKSDNIEVKRILYGTIKCTAVFNDYFALYMPHLYSQKGGYIPLWKAGENSYLYKLLVEEFETLWNINNQTISDNSSDTL